MSSMSDFDAGRLIERLEQLNKTVERLSDEVGELKAQASFGKGALWGVLLVAGSLGALSLWALQKLFGVH